MSARSVVLIHGLWLSPRSWERFEGFFSARGYEVLVPAWPRMQGDVEEIRRDRQVLAGLGFAEIVAHYQRIVESLAHPPILIGHSFGGLICQVLLDRGLGRAGVAIDSAAPKGVLTLPWSAIRAASPVLRNPFNYSGTVSLSLEQFRYAFANTMSPAAAREDFERYAVPGPGRPLFEAALANFNPRAPTRVRFDNPDRAPLLMIAGEKDHLVPAAVNRENYARYRRSPASTTFREFPGRAHGLVLQDGWEEIAGYAAEWVEAGPA